MKYYHFVDSYGFFFVIILKTFQIQTLNCEFNIYLRIRVKRLNKIYIIINNI